LTKKSINVRLIKSEKEEGAMVFDREIDFLGRLFFVFKLKKPPSKKWKIYGVFGIQEIDNAFVPYYVTFPGEKRQYLENQTSETPNVAFNSAIDYFGRRNMPIQKNCAGISLRRLKIELWRKFANRFIDDEIQDLLEKLLKMQGIPIKKDVYSVFHQVGALYALDPNRKGRLLTGVWQKALYKWFPENSQDFGLPIRNGRILRKFGVYLEWHKFFKEMRAKEQRQILRCSQKLRDIRPQIAKSEHSALIQQKVAQHKFEIAAMYLLNLLSPEAEFLVEMWEQQLFGRPT